MITRPSLYPLLLDRDEDLVRDHARAHGASVVDGHPVDVAMSKNRPSPAALFTGTVSIFRAAGFQEVGRTYVSRPIMRVELR